MINKEETDVLLKDMSRLVNKLELHSDNNRLRYHIGLAAIKNIKIIKEELENDILRNTWNSNRIAS